MSQLQEVSPKPALDAKPLSAYPARLSPGHLQEIFAISRSTFYTLLKRGQFDAFEILPRIGPRAWSLTLVRQYLEGEMRPVRMFGRKSLRKTA